jgi:DNA-binding GntR family transcriptional regulator
MSSVDEFWTATTDRLNTTTLGRQVADMVRRDILFGRLTSGTKVSQQQLCERFGVSRMPVRDALRQLTSEGLIVTDDTRHSVIARLDRRNIEDSFLIEGMLHGLAVRRVAETGTTEQFRELKVRHEAMCAVGKDDLKRFSEINWSFHRRINQIADSRKLNAALRAVALSIPRDYVVQLPEWMTRAKAEHDRLIHAMTARKGSRAETIARAHVVEAGHDLVRYLKDHGVELD